MIDDDKTEARQLLGTLLHDEPPVAVNAEQLIRKGRRRAMIARSAALGGASLAVVGVIVGAALTRPGPEEIPVATNPVPCSNGQPCPRPIFTEDKRSRALTEALRAAQPQFVPAGMIVQGGIADVPFKVTRRGIGPWTYFGSAAVGDKDGFGSVYLYIDNARGNGTCAALDRTAEERQVYRSPAKFVEFVDCRDETLYDGTTVAISRYEGRNVGGHTDQEGYRKIAVDARKPDGTQIRVTVDNSAPDKPTAGTNPTRPAPPMIAEDLLGIVLLPGVKS